MVAPVRCATPGTEVVWAIYPLCSPKATIQLARTPPPSPPIAKIAILIGLTCMLVQPYELKRVSRALSVATTLQPADHGATHLVHELVQTGRIIDDFGTIERGAKYRRMRDFATQTTAHTAIDHRSHRIATQRIRVFLDRQGRATGQANARVVPGTGVRIDPIALAHYPLPLGQLLAGLAPLAPLQVKHALTLRHDNLRPFVLGGQRIAQG